MKTLRALTRASLTCRSNIGTPPASKAFGFPQARACAQLGVKPIYIMKKKTTDIWYHFCGLVLSRKFDDATAIIKKEKGILNAKNSIGETALHYLAVENDLEGVAWLKAKGADINTQNDFGSPPVFEVAQLGYKELLKWFIENGADLSKKDEENRDIWDYLKEYNEHKMIKYLKTLGA